MSKRKFDRHAVDDCFSPKKSKRNINLDVDAEELFNNFEDMTIRSSTKMKKNFISNNNNNNNIIIKNNWNIGDLVWAALSSYPFWPAIIENAPNQDFFVKGMSHDFI